MRKRPKNRSRWFSPELFNTEEKRNNTTNIALQASRKRQNVMAKLLKGQKKKT